MDSSAQMLAVCQVLHHQRVFVQEFLANLLERNDDGCAEDGSGSNSTGEGHG
jgi:hypothetical protein